METKDYALTLAAIAVAAIFCYAVYLVGAPLLKPPENATVANASALAILLGAVEKPGNYDTYTYDYVDNIDGYLIETRMVRSPEFGVVRVQSPVFEKAIYRNRTADVLCITFYGNSSCSDADNSSLTQSFLSLNSTFPSDNAARNARAIGIYNRSNAIAFQGGVQQGSVNGKPCQLIAYVLDYSKLTLTDLRDLGISPNDPMLLYSKNYTLQYCIDNESNVLSAKVDYNYLGQARETITTINESLWGTADPSEAEHPQLANSSQTAALFLEAINAERNVLNCDSNLSSRDACIRDYAVYQGIPDLCLLAGTAKDRCILTLAPDALRSDLCPGVGNASLRDDCWIEMGARKADAAFCSNVADAQKKSYCLSLVANATNSTASLCTADSQCFAAGCSSQLCVPEGGRNTTTTCEVRPEYACLKFTTCGCVNKGCAWKNNTEYLACLQNLPNASNTT
ncbi:MAG: hypothetical protein PHS02_03815 [Candidatus ainarchaeum sp.]|nr:hypothetical protein [Candidatus ainarchaeum sp.]